MKIYKHNSQILSIVYKDKDWINEVDAFRLNNDGAKESLIEFANSLF